MIAAAFVGWNWLRGTSPEDGALALANTTKLSTIHQETHRLKSLDSSLTQLYSQDNNFYRSILNLSKISDDVWEGGIGGSERYERVASAQVKELLLLSERLLYRTRLLNGSMEELEQVAATKTEFLKHIPVLRPVTGRVLGGFGFRKDPFHGHWQFHPGLDFDARIGTPVKATGNGVVLKAGVSESGYGIQVEVDHGFGFVTKYAHLSKVLVKPGQEVKRGEVIGRAGNTGYSKGPHLHYEIMLEGLKVNPSEYLISY